MILWRFGPKRLSPSLVVWQVRHALLNVSCPDSVSAPLRSDSWGTAENPGNIRNVVQTNPEIAERDIRLPPPLCGVASATPDQAPRRQARPRTPPTPPPSPPSSP